MQLYLKLNYSTQNLQYGLPGSLILFATHTFVPQRQFLLKSRLRLPAFLYLLLDFTLTNKIPLFYIKLKVKQY